jgi:hypothetical protein
MASQSAKSLKSPNSPFPDLCSWNSALQFPELQGDGKERLAANKAQSDNLVEELVKKLGEEQPTPTLTTAIKAVTAFLLVEEKGAFVSYPGRLVPLPEGYTVAFTEEHGAYKIIFSDGTKETSPFIGFTSGYMLPGVATIYKVGSSKFDIPSVSDERISKLISMRNMYECYFKIYVVRFHENGAIFAVVDNNLHFK